MRETVIRYLFLSFFFVGLVGNLAADDEKTQPDCSTPGLLDQMLENDMSGVEEILFVVRKMGSDGHWYANFGYYADNDQNYPFYPNAGAKMCVLNLKTKEVRVILEEPHGSIRDPFVDYDLNFCKID